MPVPALVFTVIVRTVLFSTIYILLCVGHITVPAPVSEVDGSVMFSMAARDSEVAPSITVNVCELAVHEVTVVLPAMACSTILVISSLTVSPHVPVSSPCTGSASFNMSVYCVAISLASCWYIFPSGYLDICY